MIWIYFSSGRGPVECQIAVAKLAEIFCKECDGEIIDVVAADHGLLSTLISVPETSDYKEWLGTLEWVCKSPLRPSHGRKRWYINVSALMPVEIADTTIKQSDLKFESMKASGPGGQHVNKTESAIRLTHIPTGIIINAREERSQHRNKSLALSRLANILKNGVNTSKVNAERNLWETHDNLIRGNPVKSFIGPDFKIH